jgi:dTDP-4-dehydrorhamnose 3,5-epimerase
MKGHAVSLMIEALYIPEVKIVRPARHSDARGFFSETYNKRSFQAAGIVEEFVQDNHSLSPLRGTVRGLHFQIPPAAQAKLVRVVRGAIFDVAVDIRANSPTFGQFVSTVISAQDWNQIYIPVGFAHGFATLEPDTEVLYKVSDYYSSAHDKGLSWNDPAIGIPWPVTPSEALLSNKDRSHPGLATLPTYFF